MIEGVVDGVRVVDDDDVVGVGNEFKKGVFETFMERSGDRGREDGVVLTDNDEGGNCYF